MRTAAESGPSADTVARLLARYDRPPAGTRCVRCGDWGTVVLWRGHTSNEELCPADGCEAAERARHLRELA